jgi:hypothetical protein
MLKFTRTGDDFLFSGADIGVAILIGAKATASSWLVASLLPEWYKRVKQYYSVVNKNMQTYLIGRDKQFVDIAALPIRARLRLKLSRARRKMDYRRQEYLALHRQTTISLMRKQILWTVRFTLFVFFSLCLWGSIVCKYSCLWFTLVNIADHSFCFGRYNHVQ